MLTINRPVDQKPEDVLHTIVKRIGDANRVKLKMVKRYHRYFFKVLNDDEKKKWMKSNCGVIDDIKTDQDALDFAIKLRAIQTKHDGDMPIHVYYAPYLNENEAAFIIMGPHIIQDGIT